MSLFAISDLHFGIGINKTMDIFGSAWFNHVERTVENWVGAVSSEDTVIIAGDTSWGNNLSEAKMDLDLIDSLPGKKIMMVGNHDYWWQSLNKVSIAYPNISFLQNNYYVYKGTAICGTRGWICPNSVKFSKDDEKVYKREQLRLKLSLDAAVRDGYGEKMIVAFHYPPVNENHDRSHFIEILEKYSGINMVIYGHIHGITDSTDVFAGLNNGIDYVLVSSDFLNFKPIKLLN